MRGWGMSSERIIPRIIEDEVELPAVQPTAEQLAAIPPAEQIYLPAYDGEREVAAKYLKMRQWVGSAVSELEKVIGVALRYEVGRGDEVVGGILTASGAKAGEVSIPQIGAGVRMKRKTLIQVIRFYVWFKRLIGKADALVDIIRNKCVDKAGAQEIAEEYARAYKDTYLSMAALEQIIVSGLRYEQKKANARPDGIIRVPSRLQHEYPLLDMPDSLVTKGNSTIGGILSSSGCLSHEFPLLEVHENELTRGKKAVRVKRSTLRVLIACYMAMKKTMIIMDELTSYHRKAIPCAELEIDPMPRLEDYTDVKNPDVWGVLRWDRDCHYAAVYQFGATKVHRRGWFNCATPRKQSTAVSEYRFNKDALLKFLRDMGVSEDKITKWLTGPHVTHKGSSVVVVMRTS